MDDGSVDMSRGFRDCGFGFTRISTSRYEGRIEPCRLANGSAGGILSHHAGLFIISPLTTRCLLPKRHDIPPNVQQATRAAAILESPFRLVDGRKSPLQLGVVASSDFEERGI